MGRASAGFPDVMRYEINACAQQNFICDKGSSRFDTFGNTTKSGEPQQISPTDRKLYGLAAAHSALLAGHRLIIVAAGLSRLTNSRMASPVSALTILHAVAPVSDLRAVAPENAAVS